jgi:hypothetical protein
MELVLKHPDKGPIEPTRDLVAIVLCEDPMTAPRACALLRRVGHQARTEGRLIYTWWTFGVLASAALRQLAAIEAAAADMVVIAAREGPKLPEPVKDWISLWLATGEYHPRRRALVALLEPNKEQTGASGGVLAQLKHLAEADSVDFFANGDKVGWTTARTRGSVPPSGSSPWGASSCGARIAGRGGRMSVATRGS